MTYFSTIACHMSLEAPFIFTTTPFTVDNSIAGTKNQAPLINDLHWSDFCKVTPFCLHLKVGAEMQANKLRY